MSSQPSRLKRPSAEEYQESGHDSGRGCEEAPPTPVFVATVEGGQRKIDVVELLAFAEAIGFDPREAIKRLSAVKPD
jgi:hypothetical protein